jgi:hypothetical protein
MEIKPVEIKKATVDKIFLLIANPQKQDSGVRYWSTYCKSTP